MSNICKNDIFNKLKKKVHACARDGMAISLFAMLWNSDKAVIQEVLNHRTKENDQETTPLIIAARNGSEKVVSILLTNFIIDIEQTGTVKFDGYTIEEATALWCAAGAGHFGIVRLLINQGADVNHPTKTNSTALRAACFDGRLDIVRYLVEHKADFRIPNIYRNTCVMIAAYRGHCEVVRYLLENGADPNAIAHCGATALHFAAECGHIDIVQVLMKHGAEQIRNDHHMTPLLSAAEAGKSDIVDALVSVTNCTKENKIDALELLGAYYANNKSDYDIDKSLQYFEEALHVRYCDPNNIVQKKAYKPVPAYDNFVECETIDDLHRLKGRPDAVHMLSLTIRERILGPDNPEVANTLIYRGAVYADNTRFQRCIDLWLHALKLRQRNDSSVAKDLLRFAQVFSQMIHIGEQINLKIVVEVFKRAVSELVCDKDRLKSEDNYTTSIECYQTNIHTCLYLLVIAQKCNTSDSEMEKLKSAVYRFVKLNPRLENDYTPLHMAVDFSTLVDDFYVDNIVTFPNAPLAELLIECGACPNVVDSQKNTPLHTIVRHDSAIVEVITVRQIVTYLIKNGAHTDMCNVERKIPSECSLSEEISSLILNLSQLSLKCFAARCIQKNQIPFKEIVPNFLDDFILMH